MATNLILNTTDDLSTIRGIVDISASMDTGRFDTFITAAQELDIREQLGEDFYNAVNTEAGEVTPAAWYTALIPSLNPVLVWFAYARFLEMGGIMATRTGPRVFEEQQSNYLTDRNRQEQITAARSTALQYVNRMATFIEDNKDTYSDYSEFDPMNNRRKTGGGIMAI